MRSDQHSKKELEQTQFLQWKHQADQGSSEAQWTVGLCYERGQGVEQSLESAKHYYQLAADQGLPEAQGCLGYLLKEEGLNATDKSKADNLLKQAIYYLKLSAERGYIYALNTLGNCYEKGIGVEQSLLKAIRYYKQIDRDDTLPTTNKKLTWEILGDCYKTLEKQFQQQRDEYFTKMHHCLEKLRVKDDVSAAMALAGLGMTYEEGNGVKKSFKHAIRLYQTAIDAGYVYAHYLLVRLLIRKRMELNPKLVRSIPEHFKFLIQNESNQKRKALYQYELGECYTNGWGVEHSDKAALTLYKLSAENGYAKCQSELGLAYYLGNGVQPSYLKAVYYLKLAAAQSYPSAGDYLELVERNKQLIQKEDDLKSSEPDLSEEDLFKDSLSKDYLIHTLSTNSNPYKESKNFQAWKKNADLSLPISQYILGMCYKEGYGVEQSVESAIRCFQLAADQGVVEALYQLASLLKTEGLFSKAFRYFKLAAEKGHALAQLNMGICYTQIAVDKYEFGIDRNLLRAIYYYKLAVNNKEMSDENKWEVWMRLGSACKELAQQMKGQKNIYYDRRIKILRKLSHQSDDYASEAIIQLAIIYQEGKGVKKSIKHAIRLYLASIARGNPYARHLLASLLPEKPPKAVIKNLRFLAHSESDLDKRTFYQETLAWYFEKGRGVKKSIQNALYYYKSAAENGSQFSQIRLVEAYFFEELGLKRNYKEGNYYLNLVIKQNSPDEWVKNRIEELQTISHQVEKLVA